MRDRRVLKVWLFVFLLLATICTFFSVVHVSHASQVIQVPQDYPTIQEAIDAAVDYDTIQVNRRSGESQSVYYERLTVNKELTLVGESRETIIIDGGGAGSVIRVLAHNVEIRGFTIRNGGTEYNGIRSNGYYYVTVTNNTLSGNKYGISLLNSDYHTVVENLLFNNSVTGISLSGSIGNNVSDNEVSDSAYGMKLLSTDATFVVGNTVSDGSYGIYLQSSSNDTVNGNTFTGNGVSGVISYLCHDIIVSNNEVTESAYGIELHTSDTVTVLGNNVTGNSYGIYLAHSNPSNAVENNTISDNNWGIKLYNSSSNSLKGNTLSYNTFGVDPEAESDSNLIYHNNFLDNTEQAVWNPDCVNTWDDGYPSGGNHWSDYTGTDANGDGIGDTAYSIDPMNRDRYPLMAGWGGVHDIAILSVTPSDTLVYWGEIVLIDVDVRNEGTWTETFDVTVRYNSTTMGVQTVNNLAPSTDKTLTFNWNTTQVDQGSYTIEAEATIVVFETDTADNNYTDGMVAVIKVHDVAIVSMEVYPPFVPRGELIYINVTVENLGTFSETFNVTVYADRNVGDVHVDIGNETVSLDREDSTLLEFVWNTTDVPYGTYYITAEAVLPEDYDPTDNVAVAKVGGVSVPFHEPKEVFVLLSSLVSSILAAVAFGAVAIGFFKLLMSVRFRLPFIRFARHLLCARITNACYVGGTGESFPK